MSVLEQEYLGDSVYADFHDTGSIALYLNNGYGPKNLIILDQDVMDQLAAFHERNTRAWAKALAAAQAPSDEA